MSLESVVVTGIGVISPLGHSLDTLTEALLSGQSGVKTLPRLEQVGGLRSRLAATVDNIDPKQIPRKLRRSMSEMSVYAYLSSLQALQMAGFDEKQLSSGRTGVVIGSTLGSTATTEGFFADYFKDYSLERIKAGLFFQIMGIHVPLTLLNLLALPAGFWLLRPPVQPAVRPSATPMNRLLSAARMRSFVVVPTNFTP